MIYTAIAALIFAVDYRIKKHIEQTEDMYTQKQVLKGRAVIQRYHNRGAFLNLGDKKSLLMRTLSVGLTVMVLILFLTTLTKKGNGLLKTGLAFLLGGAFSNTFDRMKRKYVVDYFSFRSGIAWLDRVVFNLADFCIMIGALCVALAA